MNTRALIGSVDELVAGYAAEVARSGPVPPLTQLIARLRESMSGALFWGRVGEAMTRGGHADGATALLSAGLQQHPRTAELHYLRGNALRVTARYADAEADFREALKLAPAHRQAALSLAYMLREHGRITAAADVILAVGRQHAGDSPFMLALLDFLRDSGAHAQARTLADLARARAPGHGRLAAIAGELALAFGDFATARELLRSAVRLDPAQSSAWLRLAYCGRCSSPEDPDLALLLRAWTDPAMASASRICTGFGAAKLLDDLDDCTSAAAILRDANELARAESGWRADAWRSLIDRQAGQATLPPLAALPGFSPVFIVGLPRSGTTLVATRLARLDGVRDRGELNWIAGMYQHLAAQNALMNRDALQMVANLIANQMRRDDTPARCYVDKNPLNFCYLNLILALFPNARIVHCRRGERDTALSLYAQHFAHPDLGFSYDFAAIARVMKDHDRLMAHWRAALPARILEVDYETFVGAPDAQVERIAEFIGVPALPAAQDGGSDVITTASVWQARQPIHGNAVGRWRRYADFLPELTALFS